jgi:hypothetical protein
MPNHNHEEMETDLWNLVHFQLLLLPAIPVPEIVSISALYIRKKLNHALVEFNDVCISDPPNMTKQIASNPILNLKWARI